VPIWVANYILMDYGTGAIMSVPAHDERDFEFATKYGIEIRQVIKPVEELEGSDKLPFISEDGVLINSGEYDGSLASRPRTNSKSLLRAALLGRRRLFIG